MTSPTKGEQDLILLGEGLRRESEFSGSGRKRGKARTRLGKEIWGCDNHPQSHSIQKGREMGCCRSSPGGDKIKEEEGRLYMAGRLPNSYFILWTSLFEQESINYAVHQTQTEC